jgi:hypothetical protein
LVSFKQLAGDMHKFSRSDKKVKGPTVTHMWYSTGFSTLILSGLSFSLRFLLLPRVGVCHMRRMYCGLANTICALSSCT